MKLTKTQQTVFNSLQKCGRFSCDDSDGIRVRKAALDLVTKGLATVSHKEIYRYEKPHKIGNTRWISHHSGMHLVIKLIQDCSDGERGIK